MNSLAVVYDVAPEKRTGGPQTREGKDASRRNSLKLGLRSKVVFPEDLAALVEQRIIDFTSQFAPQSPYETMLVRDMAVSSARFERSASLSVADLVRSAERSRDCWDDDRRMSVEDYASRLSRDPSRIARGLMRSRHGCLWLIDRWNALAEIARDTGRWDESQRRLAYDLLGVPVELRPLASQVPAEDDSAQLVALAEARIAELNEKTESVLEGLDESERELAMMGMPLQEDGLTARLRKDEARARNDFAKARNELRHHRVGRPEERPTDTDPPTDRPPLSEAAIEHLVKRSELHDESLVVVREEAADEPSFESKALQGNRRHRKEMARREQEAGRGETG